MLVRPEEIYEIAFKMPWGLFEYFSIPFRLTNSLAQFIIMINDRLDDLFD